MPRPRFRDERRERIYAILQMVAAGGALAEIPPTATRSQQRPTDWPLYRQHHQTPNRFGFITHDRRVSARRENPARRYLAFGQLVAACILIG